jgi:hypothetical protein
LELFTKISMHFDFGNVSVLITAIAPVLALALALLIEQRKRKKIEKPPQQEKLLRPPGHSLSRRLDEAVDAIVFDILFACVMSGAAGVFANLFVRFLAAGVPARWITISGATLGIFSSLGIFLVIRAFRRTSEVRNLRLGLRGEQAVAEVLHELADSGFRAFHDFPGGEDWNIDHIVAGPRGVFLIETKARRRRQNRKIQTQHVVVHDGRALRFPTGTDRDAVPQAERNAKNLASYLTKKTGESVTVEALVVLPGWFVQSSGDFLIKAMNTKYLAVYLRNRNERINLSQVRRIITALDEKCRDIDFA